MRRRRYPAAAGGGDALGAEVGGCLSRDAARGPEGRDLRQRRRARPRQRRDHASCRTWCAPRTRATPRSTPSIRAASPHAARPIRCTCWPRTPAAGRSPTRTGSTRRCAQIVHESSAFYLLGYSSIKNPADGKFHQIKVRVDRPGLDVRARHGYWAPSEKAVDEAKAAAAAATPPDAVATALAALTPATSRHVLDLWTGLGRADDGKPTLTLAWARRPDRTTSRRPGRIRAGGGHE